MEAYTFVVLLNKLKEKFVKEFDLPKNIIIKPAVLSFSHILSGKDMKDLEKGNLPNLQKMIKKMNEHMKSLDMDPFEFFAFNKKIPLCKKGKNNEILFSDRNLSLSDKDVIKYSY